jgi:hypothetical protein
MTRFGDTVECSFYLPGSTLNEGRNALMHELLTRYPFTVFDYYIFVDEDLLLATDPQISSLCENSTAPSSSGISRENFHAVFTCALRYFEQILLE